MTEDQQKEAISREFLRILANGNGFKTIEPPQDHGVDMIVCPVTIRQEPNGKTRYIDSQYKLDFQLKATTPSNIIENDDSFKYDLEVKNYNDLVHRRSEPLPLHLLIVVLKTAPPNCIEINSTQLNLLGQAYWYMPEETANLSSNKNQVRITIPKRNIVSIQFIRDRFEDLGIEI